MFRFLFEPTPTPLHKAIEAHGPEVWGLCLRLAADPEDSYQAIWEKVQRALPAFDPRGDATLGTWIGTIARRTLIDDWRRRRRREQWDESVDVEDDGPSPEERLAHRQLTEQVDRALLRLPTEQRRVVVLHHLEGVPLAVLAEEEGVSLGTIKSRLHRGRARLAELIGGVA